MNADEARCVGEMTGVPVRKYKGIEHFDPRLFLEAPFNVSRGRFVWTRQVEGMSERNFLLNTDAWILLS